jgi:serine/threonine-protein kinase
VAATFACTLVVFRAVPSSAQEAAAGDAAVAEQLFSEARALMAQGRYAEACAKFQASQRLDAGVGTLLNLAECYEKSGRTASAWATYLEAQGAAERGQQPARATFAAEHARALAPHLARITIKVGVAARVPGLEVAYDDHALGPGAWGSAVPLDPGPHVIAARAPGREPWSARVELGPEQARLVEVPVLVPPAAEQPARPSAPAATAWPAIGWGLGGAGLVAVGVGSWFGLKAFSTYRDANEHHCTAVDCDGEGVKLIDDSRQAALASTLCIAIGAAMLVGGVALLWFARPPRPSSAMRAASGAIAF